MKMSKTRESLMNGYLESLQRDVMPWKQGWNSSNLIPKNGSTDSKYNGINRLYLQYVAMDRGYDDNRWMTFKQCKDKGYKLIDAKGQGVTIEFWSIYDSYNKKNITYNDYNNFVKQLDEEEIKDRFKMYAKDYTVFNAKHIDGLPKQEVRENKTVPNEFIDTLIEKLGVTYREGGDGAFYSPIMDLVNIPKSIDFKSNISYQETRLHELCHATGNEKRLNRKLITDKDNIEYAKEELRAEISASFISAEIGLDDAENELDNHKAYIKSWIKMIENNPNELFKAIKDADKITDYCLDLVNGKKLENEKSKKIKKNRGM